MSRMIPNFETSRFQGQCEYDEYDEYALRAHTRGGCVIPSCDKELIGTVKSAEFPKHQQQQSTTTTTTTN